MPFPESERVKYTNPPLERVLCQVRFPPILKIDSQKPSDFQDIIRAEYPLLDFTEEIQLDIPGEILKRIPREAIHSIISQASGKNYSFISRDKSWKINLARNFMAFSTFKYETWEDFKARLMLPLQALNEIYEPTFFTRIGLRYQNIIVRSKLNLDDQPWSELISSHFSGILNEPDICENVRNTEGVVEIQLENDQGLVRIAHGFVKSKYNDNETCYRFDNDFFVEKEIEVGNATGILDYFNRRSGRLFRWSIKRTLHEAMGPTPITLSSRNQ